MAEIYIGYDPREEPAYAVCVASLLAHCANPPPIHTLDERVLRTSGMYYRPQRKRLGGGGVDVMDGRPFSTEFTFTRFLVPKLCDSQWALFVDVDFMFRTDVRQLLEMCDPEYAVQVVKHQHNPSNTMKMDGMPQAQYARKNWSSLILWNSWHPANEALSVHDVNTRPGRWLHAFSWLDDELIGSLPVAWNWLAGYSHTVCLPGYAKAVHFTDGTPDMPEHVNSPYADEWRSYYSGSFRKQEEV